VFEEVRSIICLLINEKTSLVRSNRVECRVLYVIIYSTIIRASLRRSALFQRVALFQRERERDTMALKMQAHRRTRHYKYFAFLLLCCVSAFFMISMPKYVSKVQIPLLADDLPVGRSGDDANFHPLCEPFNMHTAKESMQCPSRCRANFTSKVLENDYVTLTTTCPWKNWTVQYGRRRAIFPEENITLIVDEERVRANGDIRPRALTERLLDYGELHR